MAQAAGADVLSIITPSFAAASQEELYTHYKTVAEAVDMPIVLYNIPARTGNALAPATVARLAEIDNIVGAKDSSGNFTNILGYIDAGKKKKNGSFYTLSGNDQLIIWTLMAGGTGGIAGCANVYPHTMASIYNLFMEGRIDEARAANESIQSFRACFKYGNPNTIVKTATRLLGYEVGPCRAPFNQVPEEGIQALKKVLAENEAKGMH
jgi:4-hydroxy-tetrahydrodipicolinate synthase